MRLRRNLYCPLHKSLSCCGRESVPNKPRQIRVGVQRIEDPHHPRGYRELRSAAEMRKLLNRKIVEQNRICLICHEEFTDYNDIVPTDMQRKLAMCQRRKGRTCGTTSPFLKGSTRSCWSARGLRGPQGGLSTKLYVGSDTEFHTSFNMFAFPTMGDESPANDQNRWDRYRGSAFGICPTRFRVRCLRYLVTDGAARGWVI